MSQSAIRNVLHDALVAALPGIDLVRENESYEPTIDRPYCATFCLFATPSNPTLGDGFYQERGIYQINLMYPAGVGTFDADVAAGQVRGALDRGTSFAAGGVTVQVDRTPEISGGTAEEGRWQIIVRVRWHADIYT